MVEGVQFKKEFTMDDFDKLGPKLFNFHKITDDLYIISSGKIKKIPRKVFGFIPYCLKPLECKYRLDYACDLTQDICKTCIVRELINFYEKNNVPYYHIIRDEEDVPKSIKEYTKKHGKFEGVIAVSCPRAVLENKHYIDKYNIPIIFISVKGWEKCNLFKALKGKWWGETKLDIKNLENKNYHPIRNPIGFDHRLLKPTYFIYK